MARIGVKRKESTKSLYMNEALLRDLESLIGKIDFEDGKHQVVEPYWTTEDRSQLLADGEVYLNDYYILAYHLGLKTIKESGIKAKFDGNWTSQEPVYFWLPDLKYAKWEYHNLKFMPIKEDLPNIKLVYERILSLNFDNTFKYQRDLVASLCQISEENSSEISFEPVEFLNSCGVSLNWKSGLNMRNYKQRAKMLKELESCLKEYKPRRK